MDERFSGQHNIILNVAPINCQGTGKPPINGSNQNPFGNRTIVEQGERSRLEHPFDHFYGPIKGFDFTVSTIEVIKERGPILLNRIRPNPGHHIGVELLELILVLFKPNPRGQNNQPRQRANNNGVNEVWGSVGIIYSNIEGGYAGEGNIDANPTFVDADNGDYTLQTPNSPGIDAGTADLNGDGTEDITDYSGSAPDMGAFESILPAPTGFQYVLQSSSVMLWWDPSTDENFQYFLLERSTDSLFVENVVSNYLTSSFYTDEDLEFNTLYFYRISYFSTDWSEYSETIALVLENLDISHGNNLPISYKIHQNHPNPFNPVTTIRYDLPEDGLVNITIYDMMGRQISTLVSGQQTAGYNIVQWNATNTFGEAVSAGLYLYTIHAGKFKQTRKMVLLK